MKSITCFVGYPPEEEKGTIDDMIKGLLVFLDYIVSEDTNNIVEGYLAYCYRLRRLYGADADYSESSKKYRFKMLEERKCK